MSGAIEKWGRRLSPPAIAYGRLEVAIMRLLFALLLWTNLPVFEKFLPFLKKGIALQDLDDYFSYRHDSEVDGAICKRKAVH